jgi:hypothetical protein
MRIMEESACKADASGITPGNQPFRASGVPVTDSIYAIAA